MGLILAIALGGAIGSVLRFVLSKLIQQKIGVSFPAGTFFVNLLGAFFIGLFFALIVERLSLASHIRAFLIVGLLGGFTTFSTFSYESVTLLRNGELFLFVAYLIGTNIAGLLFTTLGYVLGRLL